jgi:hypothetical protein
MTGQDDFKGAFRCVVCHATEDLRIAPIMTGDRFGEEPKYPVCTACFLAWHDGAGTTAEAILRYRLKGASRVAA